MRGPLRVLALTVLMAFALAAPRAMGQSLLWSARYDSGGVDALGPGRPLAVDSSGLTTIAGRSNASYLSNVSYFVVRFGDTGGVVRDRIEPMEVPFTPSAVLVDSQGDALWAGIREGSDGWNDAAAVRRLRLEGPQSEVFRGDGLLTSRSSDPTVVAEGFDGATLVGYRSYGQDCTAAVSVDKVGAGGTPSFHSVVSSRDCNYGEIVSQIAPHPDGGAVVGLWARPNIVRIDSSGRMLWSSEVADLFGEPLVRVDAAGNVYASGADAWGGFVTAKFAPSGSKLWERVEPALYLYFDKPTGLAVDAGGSVYVSGPLHRAGGSNGQIATPDIITVKYDAAGNLLWSQIYDSGADDVPAGLAMDSAGSVWVAGRAGGNAIVTLRYSADGAASAPLLFPTTVWPNVGGVALDGVGNATVAATVGGDILVLRYGWPRTDAGPLGFYTLPPCRVMDTRDAALGGPDPLPASTERTLSLADRCGIPPAAAAVSLNVTALAATDPGYVSMFRAGSGPSLTSVLNYGSGRTVANNAVIGLANGADLGVRVNQGGGSVHVIIDVNGYFADGTN